MKTNNKKTTIVILLTIILMIMTMVGCSSASKESNEDKTNETKTEDQIVLDALLNPEMVYSDDRFEFGKEAYQKATEYMRNTEPVEDLNCYKWQLPDNYVLEVRQDRSAYLTTFPIGGRKTDEDPSVFETRLLWTNIDTGARNNVTSDWYAVQDGIKATFAVDYISKNNYEVVVWSFGEKVATLPISINYDTGIGFIDSDDKQGWFHYGSNGDYYAAGEYEGVFFENGDNLYFCYEKDGEYKSKLLADDYTGSFVSAASSIFYIDEQANLVQLDVYDNDMQKIEKTIIGKNAYALTAYYGDVSWRQVGTDKVFTPEHYVSVNEKVPFGWGA